MIVSKQVRHKYSKISTEKGNYLNIHQMKSSGTVPEVKPVIMLFLGIISLIGATVGALQVNALSSQINLGEPEVALSKTYSDVYNLSYSYEETNPLDLSNLIAIGNYQIAALTPRPEPAPISKPKPKSESVKSKTETTSTSTKTSTILPTKIPKPTTQANTSINICSTGQSFSDVSTYYMEGNELTFNQDKFDVNSLTAAHPWLPMNTIIVVKNMKTNSPDFGKTAQIRINDRTSIRTGNKLDMTLGAALSINSNAKTDGVFKVDYTIISCGK